MNQRESMDILAQLHPTAAELAGIVRPVTAPTEDEIEQMVASFGKDIHPADLAHRVRLSSGPDPLQGFDIDFTGLKHKPTAYTLDFMQDILWMERGLFFDDVEYIAEGRVPIPDHMIAVFYGDYLPGQSLNTDVMTLPADRGKSLRESKMLRINFVKDEEDDKAYAEILHVNAPDTISSVPMIELVFSIESIEVIEGMMVESDLENNRG